MKLVGYALSPFSLLTGVVLSSVFMTLSVGAGQNHSPLVAVFPPWWTKGDVFSALLATDADMLDMGPVNWAMVVRMSDGGDLGALRQAGAIFFLNSTAASLCTPDLVGI